MVFDATPKHYKLRVTDETEQRTALVLRFFADLSVAETAAAMRCPEGTVKTLTRAAIASLRTQDAVHVHTLASGTQTSGGP